MELLEFIGLLLGLGIKERDRLADLPRALGQPFQEIVLFLKLKLQVLPFHGREDPVRLQAEIFPLQERLFPLGVPYERCGFIHRCIGNEFFIEELDAFELLQEAVALHDLVIQVRQGLDLRISSSSTMRESQRRSLAISTAPGSMSTP